MESLRWKYNVIVDATNLNSKTISKLENIANKYSVKLEFKRFDIDLEAVIERDKNREKTVGEDVIKKFYKEYVKT